MCCFYTVNWLCDLCQRVVDVMFLKLTGCVIYVSEWLICCLQLTGCVIYVSEWLICCFYTVNWLCDLCQ